MRALSWFICIVLIVAIVWFVALVPIAVGHVKTGMRDYIHSIPVSGSEDEIKTSYSMIWGFTPLKAEITDLKIQAARVEWKSLMFFDPTISITYVKFDPMKLMVHSEAEVIDIGRLDFEGKVHFITLMQMLEKRNPNFNLHGIEHIKDNDVKITGVLKNVQSEIILIGDLKVNADGELEFEIKRIVNFLGELMTDSRKVERIKDSLDLKWRFEMLDFPLDVNNAAVSELGVYIKAEKSLNVKTSDGAQN